MERSEIFAKYGPAMEEFGYDDIAAVTLHDRELQCDVVESDDFVHVSFAYSLPTAYKVMGELGIKLPVLKRARTT